MSKKRSRLFLSITALMFCLGIMCFGVYAATSVSYTLSGHITYDVSDVFVDIETRHYLSTQTDLTTAKGEVASVMSDIATSLESGTTSIAGVTELASDYDEQSTLNSVGGENLPLTGSELDITYGAYSNTLGQEKAYVHYIAILVTNYAEEEINAILDLDTLYDLTGSNSVIYAYRTMENIPAKSGETNGVMSYVFALGLDQPSQSVDVDFSGVSLSVTRGNLDQYASSGLAFKYSETDKGYLVSDYTGTDTRVIVPSTYDDGTNDKHPVVGTSNSSSSRTGAFYDSNVDITDIYIPKTFKTIGGYSFYECKSLKSIAIPSSVTSIGSNAFNGCTSLSAITIPNTVTSIGSSAFSGCQFSSVVYSKTDGSTYTFENGKLTIVREVPDYPAWYSARINPLITKVVFSDSSISSIGNYAFSNCSSLASIEIPSSVKSIGPVAFEGCTSLTSITIPSSMESIEYNAFDGCTSLTSITIPSSVTSIGSAAFRNCTSLTSITIPSSVTSIGSDTFGGCTSLTSITLPSSITSIDGSPFSGTPWLINLQSTSYGIATASDGITRFVIKAPTTITNEQLDLTNVKVIAGSAFHSCTSLTSITIPSSVKSIGSNTFNGCTSLTNITIPESVTSIGDGAFNGCTSLAQVTIPSGVTSIGQSTFSGCTSLAEITIPSSVASIGQLAFNKCTSLTEITIPENVKSIGFSAFSDCTKLTSVNFEDEINTWTAKKRVGSEIQTISISDPSTMATYLTSTYKYYTWTKNV